MNELGGIIGTTNPSVIQHIGEISSGHRGDQTNTSHYDRSDYLDR